MRSREFVVVVKKMGEVICLMDYFDNILQFMLDVWEDIFFEMDIKLIEFVVERLIVGLSVSSEFLILFIRGVISFELQFFLFYDFIEKGFKKLGYSIENFYISI